MRGDVGLLLRGDIDAALAGPVVAGFRIWLAHRRALLILSRGEVAGAFVMS